MLKFIKHRQVIIFNRLILIELINGYELKFEIRILVIHSKAKKKKQYSFCSIYCCWLCFLGPIKSFSTRGKHEDDETSNQFDPLVNVPELPKNRTQQAQSTVRPHWFDISSGGVGLTALANGQITIWDVENGDVRRKLQGHIEDVYVSRFFPSGSFNLFAFSITFLHFYDLDFAVVSGGADMTVRIWSLDSENNQICDTTLKGHRSRINDVLALDQQHVLSASNDGSVIQWDITKSEQIHKLAELQNNSIHSISLTNSSTLACACQDGSIRLYNINNTNSKQTLQELKVGSSISSVCYLPDLNQLVYATEQAVFGIYDIRQVDQPIHTWKEQRGRVTSIVPSRDNGGILSTTTDGSCFEYNKDELRAIDDVSQAHVTDYTGADDAILNGKIFSNKIYSICTDGLVRVYENHE